MDFKSLNYAQKKAIMRKFIIENEYIKQTPTIKQAEFVLNFYPEVLFGGSAGPGKSSALLMAALMFVECKNYNAIIFRKTYSDLALPGALISRSHEWLSQSGAKWSQPEHKWTFPSGSTLTFGYLDTESDRYRYQGSEFQCICFDEVTQMKLEDYTYLFSRLRKNKGSKIPLRMRSASNPGGIGHDWVFRRFFIEKNDNRVFIPAKLNENPHINQQEYIKSLMNLDPVTREQLLNGNWIVKLEGNLFKSEWFKYIDPLELPYDPSKDGRVIRFWDLAATEAKKGKDPDYTAGVKIRLYNGRYYIEDVIKVRVPPAEVEKLIQQTAIRDGKQCTICIEQEPGASAKIVMDDIARRILQGFSFWPVKVSDPKLNFAKILSSACYNGNVYLVNAAWNKDFVDECVAFPTTGIHDDCVDAASKCIAQLPHYATKNNEDMGIAFGGGSEIELDWK